MVAHRVASPVLELAELRPSDGIVRGTGRAAAYIDFDGFIVVVADSGTPLMSNGIALRGALSQWHCPPTGARVTLEPGRLGSVVWPADSPPVWEPRLVAAPCRPLGQRGAEILGACGICAHDPEGLSDAFAQRGIGSRDGIDWLLRAVGSRDPDHAAAAAEALIGRGPGLTPEGDDLLAASTGVIAAFGRGCGWSAAELHCWLEAMVPAALRLRTTALSATLIELAAAGQVIEPLHDVFGSDLERWPAALRRLLEIGSSTGLAYATAAGAAASLIPRPLTTTKETHARA